MLDCTISFSLWWTMAKMAIYTQKCEQKWLKINNRGVGIKMSWVEKNRKINNRGGTIIRDSRVLILPINTGEKYLKYSMHFTYLWLPAIMNQIFRNVRLEKFMTSCRDNLYHHTISNKIKFNFLIIWFGKMPSIKSMSSSGTESEIERMINFKKFGL